MNASLLRDQRLYASATAQHCITICCENLCQSSQEQTRLGFHQVQCLVINLILELSSAKCISFLSEDDRNFSADDYISWIDWTRSA